MTVTVRLPRLLQAAVGDRLVEEVDAGTAGEAVAKLLAALPTLRPHLFDEDGRLRPHVLCFIDGVASRVSDPDQPVKDEMRFVQAVSGG